MRDPSRRMRIMRLIGELWSADPDARLCQIIGNALKSNQDNYHVEDDVLELALVDLVDALNHGG